MNFSKFQMADSTEELEPLFDYSRVQPLDFACLDDEDDADASQAFPSKPRKTSETADAKENTKVIQLVDCEESSELDWLASPPRVSSKTQKLLGEDSTIKELRLKKQELVTFAQSAEDALRAMEESVKRELDSSMQPSLEAVPDQPSKPPCQRTKIVISVQDKDGVKQFRVYMDDNLERLFKMYADKVKLDVQNLVFCFDGDKISPAATPDDLGMEDNDIIEVHVKSS